MSMKKIQDSIKISINILNKALKQVPIEKRNMLLGRVNNLLTKNKQLLGKSNVNEQLLKKFQKDLEFNLNFIKLSHPNLDYTYEQSKLNQNNQATQTKKKQEKQEEEVAHSFKVLGNDGLQIERLKSQDLFDQQIQREKGVREQVQFSNWFDGNADPEQLKKHKQLLERQHFKGDYWKDKKKPEGFAKQYLQALIQQKQSHGKVEPAQKKQQFYDYRPTGIDEGQNVWQKVKR